jgi:hypothetical protein
MRMLPASSMPWAQLKSAAALRQALPSARPDGGAVRGIIPRIHAVHFWTGAWCTALGDASYLKQWSERNQQCRSVVCLDLESVQVAFDVCCDVERGVDATVVAILLARLFWCLLGTAP